MYRKSTEAASSGKPDCVNLFERCRYRVEHEPSYFADHGQKARREDPWLLVIRCHHGQIYPHGGELLGVSTDKRGGIAKRLAALDCVTVTQNGDDGINATFHVDDLAAVAVVIKPRRRRKLTEQQRAEQTARLKAYQFRPAVQRENRSQFRAPITHKAGLRSELPQRASESRVRRKRRR